MFSGVPILLAALLASGCAAKKDEGAAKLPPASGEGAPARAPLPSLTTPSQEQPAAAASTGRATTGTTYPRASAQVAPNMSGVLAQVAVKEGDRVKKGDLLFRLRAQDFDLGVQQGQAALKTAEVGLAGLKVEYDRTQRLLEKNRRRSRSSARCRSSSSSAARRRSRSACRCCSARSWSEARNATSSSGAYAVARPGRS
jgi:multidrug efflux pump subunit AcrA (membrane-fusion protein)